MRRKTLNTSYSPENHGGGYKQLLKKDHLSAFVSLMPNLNTSMAAQTRGKWSGITLFHGFEYRVR
jgi:hypothetical protein